MGFQAGLRPAHIGFGFHRAGLKKPRLKTGRVSEPSIFGLFWVGLRALAYIFGLAHFGLRLYWVQALSDQVKISELKTDSNLCIKVLNFLNFFNPTHQIQPILQLLYKENKSCLEDMSLHMSFCQNCFICYFYLFIYVRKILLWFSSTNLALKKVQVMLQAKTIEDIKEIKILSQYFTFQACD